MRNVVSFVRRGGLLGVGLLALSLLVGTQGAAAQDGTITGQVTDQEGQPLQAVQVHVVGTDIATITGSDGSYNLEGVPSGSQEVEVERIGYALTTEEVTVDAGAIVELDFQMAREALALDEVVATGTAGEARTREMGHSVTGIRADEIPEPVMNMDGMLQTRAAGVEVAQATGQVGGGSRIRLRGVMSASMSNQPLIYVDGVRIRSDGYPPNMQVAGSTFRGSHAVSSPLNDLNPGDIESIEIVRGPAATTVYGTEAAAGVINIETRRGQAGDAQWSAQIDQGFDRLGQFGPDHVPYMHLDPWMKTGHRQNYNLSVTGGTETARYFVSGRFSRHTGVIPNEEEERVNVRGNFSFNPLDDLSIDWNTTYTTTERQNAPSGNNAQGLLLNVFRQDANYLGDSDPDQISRFLDWDITDEMDRLVTGVTATYTPHSIFTNRVDVGLDWASIDQVQLKPYAFVGLPDGRKSARSWTDRRLSLEYVGTLEFDLTDDLRSRFSFGGESVASEEIMVGGRADGFAGPTDPTLGGGAETLARESRERVINAGFFLEGLLDYRDRYFLTPGLRVDGNSAFGRDFGLQAYPRLSASYVISDEAFWPLDFAEEVRFRAAYGHAGRAPGVFDEVRTWNPVSWMGRVAFNPGNVGNPDLGPERTVETEAGIDASFFGGRLDTEVSYYSQQTRDALMSVRQKPSEGFGGSQLENAGTIDNWGWEFSVSGTPYESPDLSWELGVDLTTNRNELVDLAGEPDFSLGGFRGRAVEGEPVPVMYAREVQNPDEYAEPDITEERVAQGPNYPTQMIGLHTTLRLPRGILISSRGEFQGGHYILDHGGSLLAGREKLPHCDAAVQAMHDGRRDEVTALMRARCDTEIRSHDFFIYPADHFRLQDVTLQAPIPERLLPVVENATFSASLQNAWTWINEDFWFDPSMQGRGTFWEGGMETRVRYMDEQLPTPRSLTLSVQANF